MSGLTTLIAEARRTNAPHRILQATPYAEFLGISIDMVDGQHVCHLSFRDDHIGNP